MDLNSGGVGSEGLRQELELYGSASENAAAVIGTAVVGFARRGEGYELFVFAENLNVKIFPKVRRTQDEADGRAGTRSGGTRNEGGISIRQQDLNDDFHGLLLAAMIEGSLLGAVAHRVFT